MKKNIILYVVAGAVVLAGLVTGGVIVGKKVLNKAEGTTEAVTQAFNQEAEPMDYTLPDAPDALETEEPTTDEDGNLIELVTDKEGKTLQAVIETKANGEVVTKANGEKVTKKPTATKAPAKAAATTKANGKAAATTKASGEKATTKVPASMHLTQCGSSGPMYAVSPSLRTNVSPPAVNSNTPAFTYGICTGVWVCVCDCAPCSKTNSSTIRLSSYDRILLVIPLCMTSGVASSCLTKCLAIVFSPLLV